MFEGEHVTSEKFSLWVESDLIQVSGTYSRGNDYVTEIPAGDLEWFRKTLDCRRQDDPKIWHVVD